MPRLIDDLLDQYRVHLERYRNRPFLRAAMAACALIACAEGRITLSERIRVDQILDTLERLKVFDPHEGVDLFNRFADGLLARPREGRELALAAVRAITDENNEDSRALLVRICLAVAEAGGDRGLPQEVEIVMLCNLLGVEPVPRGLYPDRLRPDPSA